MFRKHVQLLDFAGSRARLSKQSSVDVYGSIIKLVKVQRPAWFSAAYHQWPKWPPVGQHHACQMIISRILKSQPTQPLWKLTPEVLRALKIIKYWCQAHCLRGPQSRNAAAMMPVPEANKVNSGLFHANCELPIPFLSSQGTHQTRGKSAEQSSVVTYGLLRHHGLGAGVMLGGT